jgi:hypothetical protein
MSCGKHQVSGLCWKAWRENPEERKKERKKEKNKMISVSWGGKKNPLPPSSTHTQFPALGPCYSWGVSCVLGPVLRWLRFSFSFAVAGEAQFSQCEVPRVPNSQGYEDTQHSFPVHAHLRTQTYFGKRTRIPGIGVPNTSYLFANSRVSNSNLI